jgi:hypothetical protein
VSWSHQLTMTLVAVVLIDCSVWGVVYYSVPGYSVLAYLVM